MYACVRCTDSFSCSLWRQSKQLHRGGGGGDGGYRHPLVG